MVEERESFKKLENLLVNGNDFFQEISKVFFSEEKHLLRNKKNLLRKPFAFAEEEESIKTQEKSKRYEIVEEEEIFER